MAELHIIGQLLGASGFPSQSLFCKVCARDTAQHAKRGMCTLLRRALCASPA